MNDIDSYAEKVVTILQEKYPDNTIDSGIVKKNNGVELHGVRIFKKDTVVTPCFYLENYFEDNYTPEEAVESIVKLYTDTTTSNPDFNFNSTDDFFNYDLMKSKLYLCVVNKENNAERLKDSVYEDFGDLAIVLKICLESRKDGSVGSVTVNNQMFDSWNITKENVIKDAALNTKAMFGLSIRPILDMMIEIYRNRFGTEPPAEILPPVDESGVKMYVITNSKYIGGAVYLADKACLLTIANQINCKEYYIIPSSIHELIVVVPNESEDGEEFDQSTLLNMVTEVNETEVTPTEVLTDNVYKFNAETEELTSLKDGTLMKFVY